ncbi:chitin synthase-domain-containing protein [Pisolithus orientalis]|uniref:chitin synthase-domain-containing protein n=1 Tax=Pisolithus orientalis TaxID=936130 RepID=UPI002224D9F4|nr:chitin synthase-domain-containing protein [Pisolithus orientalis]KAI5986271.1 chitin synthase-domain-containing protein [Pisolithus orientalis]
MAATHQCVFSMVSTKSVLQYGGMASDVIFPVQGSVSPWVTFNSANNTDPNAQYHDFCAFTNDSRLNWYFKSMMIMWWNNRIGYVRYTPLEIKDMANSGLSVRILDGLIYDLTTYLSYPPAVITPTSMQASGGIDTQFMSSTIIDLFKINSRQDFTKKFKDGLGLDSATLESQRMCLCNLFLISAVDNRNSPQCLFLQYILLILSVLMVCIIGFKFIASINFGAVHAPKDHDKFVICQVPCYTEGEVSLWHMINSLAVLKYDDKHKLILIVCDRNIVRSGNDRPTPCIMLDILGADLNLDPELLGFHNMAKVYSGLYKCAGHVVPYLVVVKVGKPTERSRPGNCGKCDSQMVVMHFLNKVHYNMLMNPLELEMYHQIKNIIGVNPTFYEYLFAIDADMTAEPYTLNCLISVMIHDKKVLGVCGETSLANAKQSIVMMMQVYEYFISHHMAKVFESLFGSLTCLPGCFTLFRLHMPDTHNTQFIRDAHAETVAPDDWKVLLSQCHHWINSTIHNLGELMFLDQLCGFCCFSMCFIVMMDLVSMLIQPVTIAYVVPSPSSSFLQAFVFVLCCKWDMVGWMDFYILAIPIFSFMLPIYSFWHMDDFSWACHMCVVLGESGKKIIVHDEGKFDPHSILLKTWNNYENDLWDRESNHSISSWVPPTQFCKEGLYCIPV